MVTPLIIIPAAVVVAALAAYGVQTYRNSQLYLQNAPSGQRSSRSSSPSNRRRIQSRSPSPFNRRRIQSRSPSPFNRRRTQSRSSSPFNHRRSKSPGSEDGASAALPEQPECGLCSETIDEDCITLDCGHKYHECCLNIIWEDEPGFCDKCSTHGKDIVKDISPWLYKDTPGHRLRHRGQETCSSCHQNMSEHDQTFTLDCGHKYHKACLKNIWLEEEGFCDVCKTHGKNILSEDAHPSLWIQSNEKDVEGDRDDCSHCKRNLTEHDSITLNCRHVYHGKCLEDIWWEKPYYCEACKSGNKNVLTPDEIPDCHICFKPISTNHLATYDCAHTYHKECVDSYFETLSKRCGICWREIAQSERKKFCDLCTFPVDIRYECGHVCCQKCIDHINQMEACQSCLINTELIHDGKYKDSSFTPEPDVCVFCTTPTTPGEVFQCKHAFHKVCLLDSSSCHKCQYPKNESSLEVEDIYQQKYDEKLTEILEQLKKSYKPKKKHYHVKKESGDVVVLDGDEHDDHKAGAKKGRDQPSTASEFKFKPPKNQRSSQLKKDKDVTINNPPVNVEPPTVTDLIDISSDTEDNEQKQTGAIRKKPNKTCSICEKHLNYNIKPTQILVCGHEFHSKCLKHMWQKDMIGYCDICKN